MRTKTALIAAVALGAATLGTWWCCCRGIAQDATEAIPPEIFLRQPSAELLQEIEEMIARISEERPISQEQAEQLVEHILAYDLTHHQSTRSRNRAIREFIKSLDIGAIPTIAAIAVHPDVEVRRKSSVGTGALLRTRKPIDEGYAETEKALVALCLLRARDVDPEIRASGLIGLRSIAKPRWPDPPLRALGQLVLSAVTDPDDSVRLRALSWLQSLGVPIRHPRLRLDYHID